MAKNKEEKTNVVRILEAAGIPCTAYEVPLPKGKVPDGVTAARPAGQACGAGIQDPGCSGPQGGTLRVCHPRGRDPGFEKSRPGRRGEIGLHAPPKAAAPLTGYVHGGCSPVGMSKSFPTYFAEEVILVDTMICSAGKVGYQVEVAPDDLIALVGGQVADLTQQ